MMVSHLCCGARLLRLLSCSAPHIIQSQLQEVLTTVVYCDYPQHWPGLLEAVMGHLTSAVSGRCGSSSSSSSSSNSCSK
jgi:hypothetical protein